MDSDHSERISEPRPLSRQAATPASSSTVRQPEQSLPAVLGMWDLVVLAATAIIYIWPIEEWLAPRTTTFLYLALVIITFLLPTAFVTQWLARRLPGRGSFYVWVSKVFGDSWGFIFTFGTWCPGALVLIGLMGGMIATLQAVQPTWLDTPSEQGLAVLGVLALVVIILCIPLRYLKRLILISSLFEALLFLFLGGVGVWWLLGGHPSQTSFQPEAWLLKINHVSSFSENIFSMIGINFALFLGTEVRNGQAGIRRASAYVWWAALIISICYLVGTFGYLAITPANQNNATAFVSQVIGGILGPIVGWCFLGGVMYANFVLIVVDALLFSRILVTLAQHNRLPLSLALPNRNGVPVRSIIVQVAASAVIVIVFFLMFPALFGNVGNPKVWTQGIYHIFIGSAAALLMMHTIILLGLPFVLVFRPRRQSTALHRQRLAVTLISGVGIIATGIGIWLSVFFSQDPSFISNTRWYMLMLFIMLATLMFGWIGSESPRLRAFLKVQQSAMEHEKMLHQELEESYRKQQHLLTQLEQLYQEQAQAAMTDPLTGLPNHRAIMSRIDAVLPECLYAQHTCAIFFIDLDHFKQINDRWGHRVGDAILTEVGQRLRAAVRIDDLVGRYGGEEFAVIAVDVDQGDPQSIAERMRGMLTEQPCILLVEENVYEINVTASIGIALAPYHSMRGARLIERADQAMYQAKQAGGNCVRIG